MELSQQESAKVQMSLLHLSPWSWNMVVKLSYFLCYTSREQFKHIPIKYHMKPTEARNS